MSTTIDRIGARQAIEALRAGVPNRAALAALGASQQVLESRFATLLDDADASLRDGAAPKGLLVKGDFGAGKSHLLHHFRHLALYGGFCVSSVVVSKETPIFDPARFYRAIASAAEVSGRIGEGIDRIAVEMDPRTPAFDALEEWATRGSRLSSWFAATLTVFRATGDAAVRDRIAQFWAGEALGIGELKRLLREVGARRTYTIERMRAAEIAEQILVFAPRLLQAAGYRGWAVLVDEAELIGRYSSLQRGRSYAQVARLLGRPDGGVRGIAVAMAITSDFALEVIERRMDRERLPELLRLRNEETLAKRADAGMRAIENVGVALAAPDEATVRATHERVRDLYRIAYGIAPSPARSLDERRIGGRMREFIKGWIIEWDIARLYRAEARLTRDAPSSDYREDPDFETPQG